MNFHDKIISYTPEEVESALSDNTCWRVKGWINKGNGTLDKNGIKPTFEQVERGLTTAYSKGTFGGEPEDWSAAALWVKRLDYPATESQISYGLSHVSPEVRFAWASRMDFIPTEEQVTAGIKDKERYVAMTWMERGGIKFTVEQLLLMIAYFEHEENSEIDPMAGFVVKVLDLHGIQLDQDQIDRIAKSPYFSRNMDCHDFIRLQIASLCSSDNTVHTSSERKVRL